MKDDIDKGERKKKRSTNDKKEHKLKREREGNPNHNGLSSCSNHAFT